MFKSSENLRLAAEMRALERVAAPWREARTGWFDGTPESIEARLASTERVLTYARSGYTGAHMALEREASVARSELLAAKHRLLTDFLDDGARAFKGSKRVAGEEPNIDDDERERNKTEWNQWAWQSQSPALGREDYIRKHKPWLGSKRVAGNAEWHARQESERDPEMRGNYYDGPDSGDCRHCGERIEENGSGYGHVLGIDPHTGDTTFYPEDHPAEPDDEDYHTARKSPDYHDEPDYESWDGGRPKDKVEHRYEPDMEREGSRRTLPDFDDQLIFGD